MVSIASLVTALSQFWLTRCKKTTKNCVFTAGFYTGGESHRTHVTSYGVYGSLPWSWTPAVNDSIPTKGCQALWDMHNDTAESLVEQQMQPTQQQAAPLCGAHVLRNTGCATKSYRVERAASWEACCSVCAAQGLETCRNWVFADGQCHLRHNCSTGTYSRAGVTCGLFPQAPPAPPPTPLPPGFGGFAAKVNGTYSNELYAVSGAFSAPRPFTHSPDQSTNRCMVDTRAGGLRILRG